MDTRMDTSALIVSFRPLALLLVLALTLSMLPLAQTVQPDQLALSLPSVAPASTSNTGPAIPAAPVPATPAQTAPDQRALPLSFVPNVGQTSPTVRFSAQTMLGSLAFTPGEVTLSLPVAPPAQATTASATGAESLNTTVRLQFLGSNPLSMISEGTKLPGIVNYFHGNNPEHWYTDIPTYEGIVYQQLYPGIDLHYNGTDGRLKGTYVVAPHANPGVIRWNYQGASSMHINQNTGDLHIGLAATAQPLIEEAPIAWQTVDGRAVPVAARYMRYENGSIGFALGHYNPALPLVIDPALVYSTYLGGVSTDSGNGVAVDENTGAVYVVGNTESFDFPQKNALPTDVYGDATVTTGTIDIFVMKFDSYDNKLLFSTFIGGNRNDVANAVAIDSDGNAYLTGYTMSADESFSKQDWFPVVPDDAYQTTNDDKEVDAFVVKLSSKGNELLYSTYLGGDTVNDDIGHAIDVWEDTSTGDVYAHVTGSTASNDFPTTNPIQGEASLGGGTDMFYTIMSPDGTNATYSTYIGGSATDEAYGLFVDDNGTAYLTGETQSPGRKTASTGLLTATARIQPTGTVSYTNDLIGSTDAFLIKVWETTGVLTYSTVYLGGTLTDVGKDVAVDSSGNVYVTGYTESKNFYTTSTGPEQTANGGNDDVFLVILAADGEQLLYSTYIGDFDEDRGVGISLDDDENIYLTGNTRSEEFIEQSDLPQLRGKGGSRDVFVMKLDSARNVLFSTADLGGRTDDDEVADIAVLGTGEQSYIFVVGRTTSPDFPIAGNALDGSLAGTKAFLSKIGPPELLNGLSDDIVYVTESDDGSTLRIRVELSTTSSTTTTIHYRVGQCSDAPFMENEKATSDDVEFVEGTIEVPSGRQTYEVDLADIYPGNNLPDPNKEFCLFLSNNVVKLNGDTPRENSEKYTILDDDPVDVVIKPADVTAAGTNVVTETVTEPTTPGAELVVPFKVSLRQTSDQTVTVSVKPTDMSATTGSDYEVLTPTVVFAPGVDTEQIVNVYVKYDDTKERDETLALVLNDPKPIVYTLGDGTTYNQITGQRGQPDESYLVIQDPTEARTVAFAQTTYESNGENQGNVSLVMDGKVDEPVHVKVGLSPGTATLDVDYQNLSDDIVTFPAGETQATYQVPLLQDWEIEPDETISMSLLNLVDASGTPVNPATSMATLSITPTATLLVVDDDNLYLPFFLLKEPVLTQPVTDTVHLSR